MVNNQNFDDPYHSDAALIGDETSLVISAGFNHILINRNLLVYTAKLLISLGASKCFVSRDSTAADPPPSSIEKL